MHAELGGAEKGKRGNGWEKVTCESIKCMSRADGTNTQRTKYR